MAENNPREALEAFNKAKEAAKDSNNETNSVLNSLRPQKFTLHLNVHGDMDSEEAAEKRIKKAEAEKKELENKRLDLKNSEVELQNKKLDGENKLRNRLGTAAIVFVSVQLAVCNIGVIMYFIYCICKGWGIPNEVIIGWMAAGLVEVIGVLWVIARSLFPFRDRYRDKNSEK